MQTGFISNHVKREIRMRQNAGYGSDIFSLGSSFTGSNELQAVADLISFIVLAKGTYPEIKLAENRLFTLNGIDRKESSKTRQYFKARKMKKVGGGLLALSGSICSGFSLINLGGTVRHVRSLAKTRSHLVHFEMLAARMKQSDYLSSLCHSLVMLKRLKATNQTGNLGGALIMGICAPAAGILDFALSRGMSQKMAQEVNLIAKIASELHWRAYQESLLMQRFGQGKKGAPASAMVRELFGQMFRFKDYGDGSQADEYVKESVGWLVLADKLSLI